MNAFVDQNGVLTSFGDAESNGTSTAVSVNVDFCLEAGRWKWVGNGWEEVLDPANVH